MSTFRTKQKIVLIGRGPSCDVRRSALTLSRHHLTIAVGTATATLRAMETRNGTYVNGRLLPENTEVEVHPGDIIGAGACRFVFSFEAGEGGSTEFVVSDAPAGFVRPRAQQTEAEAPGVLDANNDSKENGDRGGEDVKPA